MRQRRRSRLSHDGEDDDPMSVVSNLFDVAMVFALALMVALVSRYNMTEMFSKDNFTMVKNPGKENMDRRSIAILLLKTRAINLATRERRWASLTSWRMAKSSMFRKINNRGLQIPLNRKRGLQIPLNRETGIANPLKQETGIANPLKQKILL